MTTADAAVLREATLGDVEAIMRIERASFPTDAWSDDMMTADVASEHTVYLAVVEPDGTLIGYGGILAPSGSGDADVQTIAMADAARGRGWGRRLMTALWERAAARRARALFLEVRADNPVAQALYLSMGFEQIAVRPGYYKPDNVDALIMRADLLTPPAHHTPGAV